MIFILITYFEKVKEKPLLKLGVYLNKDSIARLSKLNIYDVQCCLETNHKKGSMFKAPLSIFKM